MDLLLINTELRNIDCTFLDLQSLWKKHMQLIEKDFQRI